MTVYRFQEELLLGGCEVKALSSSLPDTALATLEGGLLMRMSKSRVADLRLLRASPSGHRVSSTVCKTVENPEWLQASVIELHQEPYPYRVVYPVFDEHVAEQLLTYFESIEEWKVLQDHYYALRTIDLLKQEPPEHIASLFSPDNLRRFAVDMSAILSTNVTISSTITVLFLSEGEGLGIHSDGNVVGKDYRLAITLSRPSERTDGGHFVILSAEEKEGAEEIVWRKHNCGVVIPLLPYSYHAVTNITGVSRYSVVFSFTKLE